MLSFGGASPRRVGTIDLAQQRAQPARGYLGAQFDTPPTRTFYRDFRALFRWRDQRFTSEIHGHHRQRTNRNLSPL
jgi:hypothetical protein